MSDTPSATQMAPPDDLTHYMEAASAYTSLRVELARIFGPVTPREGETWNAAMLRRITERLVEGGV